MKNGMRNEIQENFFKTMIDKQQTCKIIMMNGYQQVAQIIEQDDTAIIVKTEGHQDPFLMFKYAISTVMPYGN